MAKAMTGSGKDCVLAVDGGGSGTRFVFVDDAARFEASAGPANVSTDPVGAAQSILDGLASLAAQSGLDHSALHDVPAYLGLAGIVGPADIEKIRRALPLRKVLIESDQPATVEGALGDRDGAVAGLGTGSFFGLRKNEVMKLAGGWGSRIDDRASGFWIGREALRLALMTEDGRATANAVHAAVMRKFPFPADIVAFSVEANPEDIAGLASLVTESAAEDAAADDILARGAAHVLVSLTALGWTNDAPICAIGGVASCYAPYLASDADLTAPAGTALDGAMARARRFADGLPT